MIETDSKEKEVGCEGEGGRVAASSLDLINIITGFKLTGSKGVRRATGLSVTIFVSG